MATEVLQKGNAPTTRVTKKEVSDAFSKLGGRVFGGGQAGTAASELKSRKQTMDDQIDRDTNGYSSTDVEYGGNPGSSVKR